VPYPAATDKSEKRDCNRRRLHCDSINNSSHKLQPVSEMNASMSFGVVIHEHITR
jgi:hypothetical protein